MVVCRTILQILQAQLVPALTQVSDRQAVVSMTRVVCSTLRYRFETAAPPRPVTCKLCGGWEDDCKKTEGEAWRAAECQACDLHNHLHCES